MAKIYDVVAIIGEKQDGKPRYLNCGMVFKKQDGKVGIKLNAIPTNKDWDGWLQCYEPRQQQQQAAPPPQPEAPPQEPFNDDLDSDIPF